MPPSFELGHISDDYKISKPESIEPSEPVLNFGQHMQKECVRTSNRLEKANLMPMQIRLSQGQCSKSEYIELTRVCAEVKPIEPLTSNASKKECCGARINNVGGDLSLYWSNLCNLRSDHCNFPENTRKIFTPSRLPIHVPKIAELQAYEIISKRKAWVIRDFPDGCGRRVPDAKKLCISKGGRDVKTSAELIKTIKQEEKPASAIIFKSENTKKNDFGQISRQCNMLVKSEPQVRKLPVTKGTSAVYTSSQAIQWKEADIRETVKETLRMFQALCRSLLQRKEAQLAGGKEIDMVLGKRNRADLKAFGYLKDSVKLAHGPPRIGNIAGIEVGDEFHYRVELCLTGIHKPTMAGIDFTKINGRAVATSIVSSGMYSDIMYGSDVLIYEGEGGGFVTSKSKQKPHFGDQQLKRGNLALANSIEMQLPVRVIFGVKEQKPRETHDGTVKSISTYVYDGLYKVETYWSEIGKRGSSVFKFRLKRMPDQPQIPLKEIMLLKQGSTRIGLCKDDISEGREKKPIAVVNTIDNELSPSFMYTPTLKYPSCYRRRQPRGCGCIGPCVDPRICQCAAKNGGDFPFNHDGAIVRAKRLVYECGPSCRCPPSCYNRVSQHGIKFQLEIFKTEKRGWGVRSLASIPSGSFVCEYTGEVLTDSEAQKRDCDEYLFTIGNNYKDEKLWEGLSTFIPDLQKDDADDDVNDTVFTIDAAKYGGVGRFINHGCDPNLYAQNVLYDDDNKRVPHIMLFASENIPPLKELTYHYNCVVDQVHDLEGNVKTKACHCGATRCSGRLY